MFEAVKADLAKVERVRSPRTSSPACSKRWWTGAADHLEVCADQLDKASHAIFRADQPDDAKPHRSGSGKTHKLSRDRPPCCAG